MIFVQSLDNFSEQVSSGIPDHELTEAFSIILRNDSSKQHYEGQAGRMIKPTGIKLITILAEGDSARHI